MNSKKRFVEIDERTYELITKNKEKEKGILDEKKLFKNLAKGDSAILCYKDKKIEAFIKSIDIYNDIGQYLFERKLDKFALNCTDSLQFMDIISGNVNKKIRIFDVEYKEIKTKQSESSSEDDDDDEDLPKPKKPKYSDSSTWTDDAYYYDD